MHKVTLFLMSEKGYLVLKEILSFYDSSIIDFVVVASDGHVQKDFSEEILGLAKKNGVKTLSRASGYEIKTEYAFAISWRWLIHYDKGRTRLIVLHDSLLPKYRGFAPLVNQLINKERTIGVTAFFANENFDTGDIIFQKKIDISYPIKIREAIASIIPLYADLVLKILEHIKKEEILKAVPQKEEEATYSLWRDEQDYAINWKHDASWIKGFIDAVGFPYSGASSKIGGRTIRVLSSQETENLVIMNRDCGKTIFADENYAIVVCGKGLLKITEAVYDDTKESIFPLPKFRLRFS